jgi:hypothetical protein
MLDMARIFFSVWFIVVTNIQTGFLFDPSKRRIYLHFFDGWLMAGLVGWIKKKRLLGTATLGTTEECRMQIVFGRLPSGNLT